MAWCPHCNQDRPIQRQTFEDICPICGGEQQANYDLSVTILAGPHKSSCRGPVPKVLDVCSYCNTPVFAKAITKEDYEQFDAQEKAEIEKCKEERGRLDNERARRDAQLEKDKAEREAKLEKRMSLHEVTRKREWVELGLGCVVLLLAVCIIFGVSFALAKSITEPLLCIICSIICVLGLVRLQKWRNQLKAELANLLDQKQ